MSQKLEGGAASKLSKKLKNLLPVSKPIFFFLFLCLFYLALIFIFFTASCYKLVKSQSIIIKIINLNTFFSSKSVNLLF